MSGYLRRSKAIWSTGIVWLWLNGYQLPTPLQIVVISGMMADGSEMVIN